MNLKTTTNPTRFIIIRHGQTEWNARGQWQGWKDSPLTPLGFEQARTVAQELSARSPVAVYASDLGRTMETARVISEPHRLKINPSESLRERYYGQIEGLTTEQIEAQFPGILYREGRDLRDTWRPPGGETLIEVGERVMSFLRQVSSMHADEEVLVITHAGVLRVLDSIASNSPLESIWHRVPPNCAILELEANPFGEIRILNHFCTT